MRCFILKEFRLKNNMKQKVLAEILKISNSELSNYENCKKPVPDLVWQKFLDTFDEKIDESFSEIDFSKISDGYDKIDRQPNLFLKKFRKKHSITQMELASNLNVSVSYISSIEVGVNNISDNLFDKIVEVYGSILTDDDLQEIFSMKKENLKVEDSSNSFEVIGTYLRNFRKVNRIKQIKLAETLDVSPQFLSKIEYGKVKMPYELFQKFLSIYNDMITYEDKAVLFKNISKQNCNVLNGIIQNFVLGNDLSHIFYDLANMKLEKEQTQYLFMKLLDEAKTLKKEL